MRCHTCSESRSCLQLLSIKIAAAEPNSFTHYNISSICGGCTATHNRLFMQQPKNLNRLWRAVSRQSLEGSYDNKVYSKRTLARCRWSNSRSFAPRGFSCGSKGAQTVSKFGECSTPSRRLRLPRLCYSWLPSGGCGGGDRLDRLAQQEW